jgi:hypothetical protein
VLDFFCRRGLLDLHKGQYGDNRLNGLRFFETKVFDCPLNIFRNRRYRDWFKLLSYRELEMDYNMLFSCSVSDFAHSIHLIRLIDPKISSQRGPLESRSVFE